MDSERNIGLHPIPDLADGTDRQRKKKRANPCKGCYYHGGKTENVKCCNYFLITGKRRPCEAGENCTVRCDGSQIRRKAMKIKDFSGK